MKIVKGSKTEKFDIDPIKSRYDKVILDMGTGDGRFVYKTAEENPQALVIGVDPSQKQLQTYSKKVNREKLENALFVVGSIEVLPKELKGISDEVFINFPWGSLLGGISNSDEKIIKNISSLVKEGGKLEITFGYSQDAEPAEVKRLKLDQLTEENIKSEIIPEFEKNELKLSHLSSLQKEEYFKLESSWGKKLTFGQERKIFKLIMHK